MTLEATLKNRPPNLSNNTYTYHRLQTPHMKIKTKSFNFLLTKNPFNIHGQKIK